MNPLTSKYSTLTVTVSVAPKASFVEEKVIPKIYEGALPSGCPDALPSATIRQVRHVEAIWTRILGVLLILLGLVLLASPRISYSAREKIPHTQYSVKRDETLVVPRAAAALVIASGVAALVIATRTPKQP